jgi:sterol desaturase/sphingolipid hydroxylase (fatty acid hydroxylase superfamily)
MSQETALLRPLLPILAAFALAEYVLIRWRRRGSWDWAESGTSLAIAAGQSVVGAAAALLWSGLFQFAWRHRLATVPLDTFWGISLLCLGVEFSYYLLHRASHEVRYFWASHAVHHSVQHLNLSAAYRLGWTAGLSGAGLFYLPLVWLGFAPNAVFLTVAIGLLFQFLLHTEQVGRLGLLESVFNTPSHHRVHHASHAPYLDANFGGVLIVFDRLFGTFVAERADLPCRFGLVQPVRSQRPLHVVFHEWLRLIADLRRARTLQAALATVFGRPGWRADGPVGNATDAGKRLQPVTDDPTELPMRDLARAPRPWRPTSRRLPAKELAS